MKKIIDATLREGNQSPNVRFTVEQSVEIAKILSLISVDMIEIGHPSASSLEMDRVKQVVQSVSSPVLAHARAHEKDIRAVAATGAPWIGIFAGINELSQKFRLNGKTKKQVLELIKESVLLAKSLGLCVRYTVEDSSRTPDLLNVEAYETAISAGADRICFADTVGVLEPTETFQKIYAIKNRFLNVDLEVHFHDDRGLALSNSLAAIDAGADWLSTSVNGLGERCGITDTCAMLANLYYRENRDFSHYSDLCHLSQLIADISNAPPDVRRPIIGKHAFQHTAKLHTDAMSRNPETYTWFHQLKPSLAINKL